MDSREVIGKLKSAGWYEASQVGSHKQFKHPKKRPCHRAVSEEGHTSRDSEEHREAGRAPAIRESQRHNHGLHRLSSQKDNLRFRGELS